jgi:dienelactone hydrolase
MRVRGVVASLAALLGAVAASGCALARTEIPLAAGARPTPPAASHLAYARAPLAISNTVEGQIDAHDVRLLRFPSVGENGQDGNRVTVRFYELRDAGRRPLVVILPIWGGHTYPSSIVATDLVRTGRFHVMHVLGADTVIDWDALTAARDPAAFLSQLARMVERVRATIVDLRRLLDWAEGRPGVDARQVAMVGFSESALQVAGIMASDARLAAAILVMGGAHPNEVLATCYGPPSDMRDRILPRFGWTAAGLAAAMEPVTRPVDPAWLGSRLAPARVLIVEAADDDCIPATARRALWEAAGRPARVTVRSTHAGAFLAMTFLGANHVRHRIMEFLEEIFPPRPRS